MCSYISWQYDSDRFDPGHMLCVGAVLVPVGGQDLVCWGGTMTSILRHDVLTISLEVQPLLIKGDTVRIPKAGTQTDGYKYKTYNINKQEHRPTAELQI